MIDRTELLHCLDALLEPERFKDHRPNGLQVEGRREARSPVSRVTARQASIEAAIEAQPGRAVTLVAGRSERYGAAAVAAHVAAPCGIAHRFI